LGLLLAPVASWGRDVTMFAAASLTDALKDVSAEWVKAGHTPFRLSFGASSSMARQIEQGAPANVYASADQKWMDYLAGKNLIVPDTRRNLLGNQLVLIVPSDRIRPITVGPTMDLNALLGLDGRIATGDPAHVPVGLYARQALISLGLWDAVQPRLARTEDVRAALLLVERGEAPAGIVYATDAAMSKGVAIAGAFPADSHDPIIYPFAVTKAGDSPESRAVMDYLSGPQARDIFKRHGFKTGQDESR
ncbi:MAG: molybdate ABC transporter substrate-binding protein, partial [Acetobacteraceae bacterium]